MGLIDFINKFKKMKMDIKYAKILNVHKKFQHIMEVLI